MNQCPNATWCSTSSVQGAHRGFPTSCSCWGSEQPDTELRQSFRAGQFPPQLQRIPHTPPALLFTIVKFFLALLSCRAMQHRQFRARGHRLQWDTPLLLIYIFRHQNNESCQRMHVQLDAYWTLTYEHAVQHNSVHIYLISWKYGNDVTKVFIQAFHV